MLLRANKLADVTISLLGQCPSSRQFIEKTVTKMLVAGGLTRFIQVIILFETSNISILGLKLLILSL